MFLKKHTVPGTLLKMRNAIDLREQNVNTHKLASPLPDQRAVLYRVASHHYISSADGQDAYKQIRINPEDVKHTLVNTPDGTIESLVMQQGDCHAVAMFMNIMMDMFSPYLSKWLNIYLDDIMIYNNSLEEHVCCVKIVIDTLKEHKFYLAEHKLHFLPKELKLLGHIITCDGKKVDGIVAWKTPTNRNLLRSFLSSVGYLADGVEGVRISMDVLNWLTGDTVAFCWGPTEQRAFEEVKARVATHRELHCIAMQHGKDAKPVHLVTDGCISGIAGKISQGRNWKTSPVIVFYSAKLSPAQQNYTVTKIEMLAGLETMICYRDLLLGVHFTWYTNHCALEHLLKQRDLSGRQARWMIKLAEFNFDIKYVPGKENVLSDSLSRMYSTDAPGTVQSPAEYVQHDDTSEPVRLFGASTIVAGAETEATVMYCGKPLDCATRVLRERTAPQPAPAPLSKPKAQKNPKKQAMKAPAKPVQNTPSTPEPDTSKKARVRVPEEPAETGHPETSKEFAKRIKRVVLNLPEQQPEGTSSGEGEAPVGANPESPSSAASPLPPPAASRSNQAATTGSSLPQEWCSIDAPNSSALLDTLAPSADLTFADCIRGKARDDKFFARMIDTPQDFKNFSVTNGLVYLTDRGRLLLCVPDCRISARSAREIVIEHAHSLLAHLGSARTLAHLRNIVWWKTIVTDVAAYVESCVTCRKIKPNNQRPYGLLNLLTVPLTPWEALGVDFIGKLPESKNRDSTYDCIVVFICLLTNMVHIVPGKTTYRARDMAELIFAEIYKCYGLPARIISDQDRLSTSTFWTRLHKLLGVKLRMSSTYHPKSDGASERANCSVITMLRACIDLRHKDWAVKLPAIKYTINSARSESTGFAPFFLNMRCMPRSLIWDCLSSTEYPSVRAMAQKLKQTVLAAHDLVLTARVKQKREANRTLCPSPFSDGDLVYVSTQNISFPKGRARKFLVKYIGPYKITQDFGNNSYCVALPDRLRQRGVRNVFHSLLLRPHIPNDDRLFPGRLETHVADFEDDAEDSEWAADRILSHVSSGRDSILEVQWRAGNVTWVKYDRIRDLPAVADYLEAQGVAEI
jgi:hypothetical protein